VTDTRIEAVDALDFRMTSGVWDFSQARADEIAAHWRRRHAEQPKLFNGRVLVLARHALEGRTLRGEFIETDFADFLAWREFGLPASNACNGFSMAALRGADGGFLLGEMSPHTASAGAIYFPAGTPDLQDVFGGVVDLEASARRELTEETGLDPTEADVAPGWTIVRAPGRVACMKPMRLRVPAEEARARIEAQLASEARPEFCRIHVVRSEADFRPRMPEFVRAFMAQVFEVERGSKTAD
jgi:8-oxo-dGTP pyrophosphatase MutT (NUDIX family)